MDCVAWKVAAHIQFRDDRGFFNLEARICGIVTNRNYYSACQNMGINFLLIIGKPSSSGFHITCPERFRFSKQEPAKWVRHQLGYNVVNNDWSASFGIDKHNVGRYLKPPFAPLGHFLVDCSW